MARKSLTVSTIRALFARSGNQCAFPDCSHPLINDAGQFVAQVCHIEAAEGGGPRFRHDQTDDERRSKENLLLMCYRHHVETNDVLLFPIERLVEIKLKHEAQFSERAFKIKQSLADRIATELDEFWQTVSRDHKRHRESDILALDVNFEADYFGLVAEIERCICGLKDYNERVLRSEDQLPEEIRGLMHKYGITLPSWDEGKDEATILGVRNWEWHVIYFGNLMRSLDIYLSILKAKHLELYLQLNPDDCAAKEELDRLRAQIKDEAYAIALD